MATWRHGRCLQGLLVCPSASSLEGLFCVEPVVDREKRGLRPSRVVRICQHKRDALVRQWADSMLRFKNDAFRHR